MVCVLFSSFSSSDSFSLLLFFSSSSSSVYVHLCVCVCICVYVHMYVYLYVRMYAYVYMCVSSDMRESYLADLNVELHVRWSYFFPGIRLSIFRLIFSPAQLTKKRERKKCLLRLP